MIIFSLWVYRTWGERRVVENVSIDLPIDLRRLQSALFLFTRRFSLDQQTASSLSFSRNSSGIGTGHGRSTHKPQSHCPYCPFAFAFANKHNLWTLRETTSCQKTSRSVRDLPFRKIYQKRKPGATAVPTVMHVARCQEYRQQFA